MSFVRFGREEAWGKPADNARYDKHGVPLAIGNLVAVDMPGSASVDSCGRPCLTLGRPLVGRIVGAKEHVTVVGQPPAHRAWVVAVGIRDNGGRVMVDLQGSALAHLDDGVEMGAHNLWFLMRLRGEA